MIIRRENAHCENLSLLIRLVRRIESEASFYSSSFADIAERLAESSEFSSLDILREFCANISEKVPAPTAWRAAVNNTAMYITDEEKSVLVRFGEDMCSCSREKIGECAREATAKLEQSLAASTEKKEKNVKAKAATAVCAGIAAALILL